VLYFSKLRILFITLFSLLFILIASSNLFKIDDDFFDKKINLGLDLQGGSYLLLEIDNAPVIEQKLQNLTTTIRNYFNEQSIRINNIKIEGNYIFFNTDDQSKQIIIDTFTDENSDINPYYPRFKSHQLNIEDTGVSLKVNFSKQGLINLKTSSQDQAIEIVRRRIDEVGTNEPNILKRGNNRILVELPGAKDVERVKGLLQSTAQLEFWDAFKGEEFLSFMIQANEVIKSKTSTVEENQVELSEVEENKKDIIEENIDESKK